ncbi:MAG: hypothetical protein WD649_06375 [Thermoleophilaceae bacterium]
MRAAAKASRTWTELLRRLGYCTTGGNHLTLKKYCKLWEISTAHFDPHAVRAEKLRHFNPPAPLEEILVKGSSYSRGHLKKRLYREGLKERRCEACGQGEIWRGEVMSLILDHANGLRDDHRLENLRILCPNCAATLATHCGRKGRHPAAPASCEECGREFYPYARRQRFCSKACGIRGGPKALRGRPKPKTRRAERPPYEQLLREIEEHGHVAVGCKYGVSDNAIRKWVVWYEREAVRKREADGANPPAEAA